MNNILSEKLGNNFFDGGPIISTWLNTLEDAVSNCTIAIRYSEVLTDVLACSNDKTQWQGLGLFVMVLGDSKMWNELFLILDHMKAFLQTRNLMPTQKPFGLWNHAIHNLVFLFRVDSEVDAIMAEHLIHKADFFAEDSYHLIKKIEAFYTEKNKPSESKKWLNIAKSLEHINHQERDLQYA